MALALITVTNSIAAISVSGVTVLDVDQLPTNCLKLHPVLYPEPLDFISGLSINRDSWGPGTTSKKTITYTLRYTFLYAPTGAGRSMLELYDDMVSKATLILDAIIENDSITGCVDIEPAGAVNFGPVPDPSGNMFHGCQFEFRVTEFVN